MKRAILFIIGLLGLSSLLLGLYGLYVEVEKAINGNPEEGIFFAFLFIGIGVLLLKISIKQIKKPIGKEETESIQTRSRKSYRNVAQKKVDLNVQKTIQTRSKTTETTQKLNNIFLSYRRNDSANVTGRIYDKLLQSFDKKQIFKDVDSIPLGVDFRKHLNQKVGECNVLIAVIGNQWIESDVPKGQKRIDNEKDFVRIEIESALERNIPVIPVLVRDARMPAASDLPESMMELAFRNGIPVRPDPDFHRDMERLIQGIKHHI